MSDIDGIIEGVTSRYSGVTVRQHTAKYAADDVGLWFFSRAGSPISVQLESAEGRFPFLVENTVTNDRVTVTTVESAVQLIAKLLGVTHP